MPSIRQQFGRYEHAKDIWDLLASRYTTINLFGMPRQPINDFLLGMQSVWDRLELSEHIVNDPDDAKVLASKRDNLKLIQFLMTLTSDFKLVRVTLVQQIPLPIMEFVVK